MNKYHRFMFYLISGFFLITIYLVFAILSEKDNKYNIINQKVIKTPARDIREKTTETWKVTEKEIMALLRKAEAANNNRLQRVEEVCGLYNLGVYKKSQVKTLEHPPVPQYSVFYFDRENKLAFCPIYKAGSSTWLYNLLLLAGMTEDKINNSKKQLSDLARQVYPELDPPTAEEAFLKTIKILTVRHPFERLLSAYRDKLENTNAGREHGSLHFYQSFGSKIVKKYRQGGNETKVRDILQPHQYLWNPKLPPPSGIEPTFREFVMYIIDSNLVQKADDHWIPYYLYCTPCLLRYDIIAKVETMEVDQLYAIHVLGLENKIKPKWQHKTQFVQENSSGDEVSFISKIYFRQLSVIEINKLYDKYKVDFELFGYNHTEYVKYAFDYKNR